MFLNLAKRLNYANTTLPATLVAMTSKAVLRPNTKRIPVVYKVHSRWCIHYSFKPYLGHL